MIENPPSNVCSAFGMPVEEIAGVPTSRQAGPCDIIYRGVRYRSRALMGFRHKPMKGTKP